MSNWTLDGLIDALHEIDCTACATPSEEGMDNLVEAAIDLLWPKASRTLRGDGWVLMRAEQQDRQEMMEYDVSRWMQSVKAGDGRMADRYLESAVSHADALLGRPVEWEDDMSSLYTKDQVFEWEIKAGDIARTVAGRVDVPEWANLDRIQLEAMLYDALVALREQMTGANDE